MIAWTGDGLQIMKHCIELDGKGLLEGTHVVYGLPIYYLYQFQKIKYQLVQRKPDFNKHRKSKLLFR